MESSAKERNGRCSIARSLELFGGKWSLLIVREIFRGHTRFSDIRAQLGMAPDVLSARLVTLVEGGVLVRRSYREDGQRQRDEYVLTEAGAGLRTVLGAVLEWGDRYAPHEAGPTAVYVEADSGDPVHLVFMTEDRRTVPVDKVASRPGPGAVDQR